jgi:hypothetical protein
MILQIEYPNVRALSGLRPLRKTKNSEQEIISATLLHTDSILSDTLGNSVTLLTYNAAKKLLKCYMGKASFKV